MPPEPEPTDSIEAMLQALVRAHAGGPAADDRAYQGLVTCVEQAYAIQQRLFHALGHAPGVPMYWKSGAASSSDPMRHAPLPNAGVRPAGADLRDLPLRHRWIEAEVALRLARDVTPDEARDIATRETHALGDGLVDGLVDGMCVAIEVVDCRWAAARQAAPLLKLVDLLVHGALVLGTFVPYSPRAWAQQACHVRIGAAQARSFSGSLGIGDPASVLPAWLQHVTRNGATVPAGSVVSTGSWCGLLEAAAEDAVSAEFPGIGVVSLQL